MLVSMRLVVLRKDEGEKWLGAYFFGSPPHRGQFAQARGEPSCRFITFFFDHP